MIRRGAVRSYRDFESMPEEKKFDLVLGQLLPFLVALLQTSFDQVRAIPVSFLQLFEGEASRSGRMARFIHYSVDSLLEHLILWQGLGQSSFLTVNSTDGIGRRKHNITQLRAWHADLDGLSELPEAIIRTMPLRPSIVVASGHGYHLYWLLREFVPCIGDIWRQKVHEQELKSIQESLAHLGADDNVCDISRVLRVPGFFNLKREPFPFVEVVELNDSRYAQQEIREAFKVGAPPRGDVGHWDVGRPFVRMIENPQVVRRACLYAEALGVNMPAISGQGGHRNTLIAALKVACGFDLSVETAFEVLWDHYNPHCQPPWSREELRRKVEEALAVGSDRGRMLNSARDEIRRTR